MTMQFLASVRRNQRQWMVVITILSIFAFLFDDVARGGQFSSNAASLFIGVLCAGVMAILGYPRGHTVAYAVVGFIAGGGAALVGSTFAANKPVVRTSLGTLSATDLRNLVNRRAKAQRFVQSAAFRANKSYGPVFIDFNGTPAQIDRQTVGFWLIRREAHRLGVSVSNEAVNQFIKRFTQEKLTEKDYIASLREAQLSESELFDLLRDELEYQLVSQLMHPSGRPYEFIDLQAQQRRLVAQAPLTPELLWEHFKKLNVHQQLTSVALPVTEFVKLVTPPAESELKEFFDRYKGRIGDEFGNPGFLELAKVRLGYLVASNLEAYEKGLPNASDEEVVQYYFQHKEEFRAGFEFPPSSTTPPRSSVDPDAPADATTPENSSATPVNLDAPRAEQSVTPEKSGEAPASDKKTEKTEPTKPESDQPKPADPPKEADKKAEEKKDEANDKQSSCGEDPPAQADQVQAEPVEAEPKQPEPAKPDATKSDPANPSAEPAQPKPDTDAKPSPDSNDKKEAAGKPAAETTPGPESPPSTDFPGLPGVDLPPAAGGGPRMPPAPRYRELDAELKEQIREKILLNKAFERMSDAAEEALRFMEALELEYATAEKSKREVLADGFVDRLKEYAAKNGLEYRETKPLTYDEMLVSREERIGSAGTSGRGQRQRTVAAEVFTRDDRGAYLLPLYTSRRADSPAAYYAYWKIEEIPEKVRDLKDETTHQMVVDAWKFEKARELAEKRARELAELMKKGEADIPGALSGQTINGTMESPAVTVQESKPFTWLRSQHSFPQMGFSAPVISSIDGIEHAGRNLMKIVFEDLKNGEAGVVLNEPRSVFYAVRVHDRQTDATVDGGVALQQLHTKFLNEKFSFSFPTPYDLEGVQLQNGIEQMWRDSFNTRYSITFENSDRRTVVNE